MPSIFLNRDFDRFFCPLSGEPVILPEGYNTPSSLLFIYVEEIQDFEYCSKAFRTNYLKDHTNPASLIEDLRTNEELLQITYDSMGPVTLGFDLRYENKQ